MQNEPHDNPPLQVSGVVLVTREERLRQKKTQDILQVAKGQAKKLIVKAQAEEEALQKLAYSQGYEQGVLSAARATANFMCDHSALVVRLHDELSEKAREVLNSALSDENIFPSLLESWSNTLEADGGEHPLMELLVPEALGLRSADLVQKLERVCGQPVRVTYHQDNRYVMKCKGQLAEFIPDDFIDQKITQLIDIKELQRHCEHLSQQGLAILQSELMSHFDSAPQDAEINI
ncbi:hypothetical protein [Serratia liquefaciens]|uniref:hypothetical protein n=1 Tax=Serratia liquefaciens TaxID=614 RepID=UPI002158477A|nr:hypothetical protein [Serratia liquefaciens]